MDKSNRSSWKSTRPNRPLVISEVDANINPQTPKSENLASEVEEGENDAKTTRFEQDRETFDGQNEMGVEIITPLEEKQTFTIDTPSSSGAKSLSCNGETEQNVLHVVNSPLTPDQHDMREDVGVRNRSRFKSDQTSHPSNGDDVSRCQRGLEFNEQSRTVDARCSNPFRSLKSEISQVDRAEQHSAEMRRFHEVIDLTKPEEDEVGSNRSVSKNRNLCTKGSSPDMPNVRALEASDHGDLNEYNEISIENLELFDIPHEYVKGVLDEPIHGDGISNKRGPGQEAGEIESGNEANGKGVRTPGNKEDSTMMSKRRRLNSSEVRYFVGKQVVFQDFGGTIREGVIEKQEHKRIFTIMFEDRSHSELVLESEKFFVFGKAVNRFIRNGLLTRDDIDTQSISCVRSSLNPIDEESMVKVSGSQHLVKVIEKDDFVFVSGAPKSRFLAGRVVFVEIGPCSFVKLLHKNQGKWLASNSIRQPCEDVIELD